jgi:SAM-dependent methyltransferase
MVHHDVCPLCSSEKIRLHFRCADHFISKEVFDVYECDECSFEFTQDYPEATDIGKYYESDDYISHSDTSKGLSNRIYHIARKIMLIKKRRIIERSTHLKKGNILDIGSGNGHFAFMMKKAGWLVKGIEINEKARDFAISKFGLEIISDRQISTLETNSFDCITLWHVLEHFHDPENYTSEVLRLLKPGGLCLIALPNSNSHDAQYYQKYWAAYDVPRHLWHFNPTTFGIFSARSGFVFEKIKCLPLDVFYISILSERYRGTKFAFLTGTLMSVLFSFLSLFNKEKNSSIIYLLRNPAFQ